MAVGKFNLFKNKGGEYQFNLLAANNQVIGTSESYKSKDGAKSGIDSVKHNCSSPVEDQTIEGFEKVSNPKFEVYKDKRGEFRFRLKAKNGEPILTGEGYKSKASCLNGIASIGNNAPDAPIVEVE